MAYGGLVALGLGHCGDRVVVCESPPPPPSVRERALTVQAAAQVTATATLGTPAAMTTGASGASGVAAGAQLPEGSGSAAAQDPRSHDLDSQQPAVLQRETGPGKEQRLVATVGASDSSSCGGGGDEGVESWSLTPPALLLVAPECGLALVVACNTAGPQGATFCRNVRASAGSWGRAALE